MVKVLQQRILLVFGLSFLSPIVIAATTPSSWSLEQRIPYEKVLQQTTPLQLTPLTSAKKSWRICALVPHLKDTYWTGINYGLVQQAKALNLKLELFEAGGYYGQDKQLTQLDNCMKHSFDAILLGGVRPDILDFYQAPITKPVIALVNRLQHPKVNTRVGVNWYQMGLKAGEYIKQQTKKPATLALLTGPDKLGGSDYVEQGLSAALKDSLVNISAVHHADNNRNLYRDELEVLLSEQTPDYILGSAVAIEAGVSILRQYQLTDKVKLVSSYLSPAVLRGIYRGKVAFSNDDQVVLQGKLAIDITVRELEGAQAFGDIGPKIKTLYPKHISEDVLRTSLPPADYYPIYRVNTGY
ncbi:MULTISPECIES: TMAO reductase system periplasmic protein TorT [unclassified Shewanella]|uniref:TMAO reductase system periplasmic protein TorT n=1 Tax=unclassified Shewanella TaxID=196818 RepID=UPI001BC63DAC|nr:MULTISPECIES: TMAO reductase system periplasmic protein TorT [unclassified Shewanella]GIU05424.1 TMAO reductase system periplasmic protein TorT [Shewanella sp. MBTL60-112-B1]GIU24017.1 TMAO reductase system periplasmic protein TorT [Shewanella sp. MBTL60-112-B2]